MSASPTKECHTLSHTPSRRYPPLHPRLYQALRGLLKIVALPLVRLHIEGAERIPAQGPYIVVTNHLSYIDSPIIGMVIPSSMYVLAGEKYERHPFFGPILRVAGAIFINRGEPDRSAIRQVLAVLADGHRLGIAVEGTRSKTGGLIPGKTGPAYFATRADVPLVPLVIWGTEKFRENLLRLRRTDVTVHFGDPFRLPAGHAGSEELARYTDEIMATLASMLPEAYRGVYRDHPLLRQKLAAHPAH
jgi:1-acyl-sn-glycerol-3-phosphate acyltransferase